MSYSLEATIHVPLCLVLLCLAVLQFPLEYSRQVAIGKESVVLHRQSEEVYEALSGDYVSGIRTRPEKLVDMILWTGDTIDSLTELVKGRTAP